jgi:cytochrome b561
MSSLPSPQPSAHARHQINLRLERWHRRCVYLSWATLLVSGIGWLVARYFLRPVGQFGETVNPFEPWAMKLHGAGAMAMLFFLGSLMNAHVRRALKTGRNLVSGWLMIGTFALLVVTGFGLYYLAGESDRPVWSALHWVVGLGVGILFVLHIVLGRRSRVQRSH